MAFVVLVKVDRLAVECAACYGCSFRADEVDVGYARVLQPFPEVGAPACLEVLLATSATESRQHGDRGLNDIEMSGCMGPLHHPGRCYSTRSQVWVQYCSSWGNTVYPNFSRGSVILGLGEGWSLKASDKHVSYLQHRLLQIVLGQKFGYTVLPQDVRYCTQTFDEGLY